jgi:hypothetical protein
MHERCAVKREERGPAPGVQPVPVVGLGVED